MISQLAGPASLVLSASVARRYYLDGRSKTEIADEFGLSRFKVARLIETARAALDEGEQAISDFKFALDNLKAAGLDKAKATSAVDAVFDVLQETMASGDDVRLVVREPGGRVFDTGETGGRNQQRDNPEPEGDRLPAHRPSSRSRPTIAG